jgi:hypothetical protein
MASVGVWRECPWNGAAPNVCRPLASAWNSFSLRSIEGHAARSWLAPPLDQTIDGGDDHQREDGSPKTGIESDSAVASPGVLDQLCTTFLSPSTTTANHLYRPRDHRGGMLEHLTDYCRDDVLRHSLCRRHEVSLAGWTPSAGMCFNLLDGIWSK